VSENATVVLAKISNWFRARKTLILVRTDDELRVERALIQAAATAKFEMRFWDCDRGLIGADDKPINPNGDPNAVLNFIRGNDRSRNDRAVYVLRDLHKWFGMPDILRKLRNLSRELQNVVPNEARCVVLLSPMAMEIPRDIPELKTVDFPLPDRDEVDRILSDVIKALPENMRDAAAPNGTRERAVDAALGLSALHISDSYSVSLVTSKKVDPALVTNEKKALIAGIPGVTWHEPDPRGLDAIGGYDDLKGWCMSHKVAFTQEARDFGLPAPKGLMLVGLPGTGKSLAAKCIATVFGVPLLRGDLGGAKSKFVGDSEQNIRRLIQLAETMAPCVLWFDEIEKALAGASGPQGDGGVSTDALGVILSWMQEKTASVFVIATANDVRQLPPELLRKGRFDEMFFVDLPQHGERMEIVAASLKLYNRSPDLVDLATIAGVTDGFVGAEIAALVPDALFAAFADGKRAITTEDLRLAATKVVPLSKTASEKISTLREWAKGRARPASAPEKLADGAVRSLDL
jgi:AAA+ superfamily predicted ATPase